jgi:hypothetical protein
MPTLDFGQPESGDHPDGLRRGGHSRRHGAVDTDRNRLTHRLTGADQLER